MLYSPDRLVSFILLMRKLKHREVNLPKDLEFYDLEFYFLSFFHSIHSLCMTMSTQLITYFL